MAKVTMEKEAPRRELEAIMVRSSAPEIKKYLAAFTTKTLGEIYKDEDIIERIGSPAGLHISFSWG